MPITPGPFSWVVQSGAYTWTSPVTAGTGETPRTAALCLSVGDAPPTSPERYQPLVEQTGLFLVFAATEPTQSGVMGFADRFGMLAHAQLTLTPPDRVRGRRGSRLREALARQDESLEFWQTKILKMREAVRIWEMLERGDLSRLAAHIRWVEGADPWPTAEYDSHPDLRPGERPEPPDQRHVEVIGSPVEEEFGRVTPGDAITPARLLLRRMMNRELEGRLRTVVAPDPEDGDLRLGCVPADLLGAMWLQLALAVTEHKQYRRCQACATPFELSPETARTNKRFCSIACKNRSFRARKERAQELHAAGKTPAEIAEELGASVTVVEGWLGSND